jgi:O-antigen/teichoic acid export membrane protein
VSLAKTIVRNIASSWAGYAVQAVVSFLLTPYILHSLGETRYGVWTLAIGLTGYYGLLDLGISAGIGQYLTRYIASKDLDRMNRTVSTGLVALTVCGTLIFLGSIAIALNASALFQIPADVKVEVALVVVITGFSVALQFVFFTYSAVFTALQRFDVSNAIGVATRLVTAIAAVVTLKLGYGLIGLSVALTLSNILDYLVRWRVAKRLLPSMRVSMSLVSYKHFSEVMRFGVWNLTIAGGVRLISYTDALVIAASMPVSAVAPFAVAASLRSYFDDIFVRAGYVFFPAATELDARGDTAGLRSLYLISSKFMLLAAVWGGCVGIYWASAFFRLWIGKSYSNPVGYPAVGLIFSVLLVASMVSVGQRIGYQVLMGIRKVRLLAILFALEGLTNLVLSVILVRYYGLLGVALGTLIPAAIYQGVLQPLFVCRTLKVSLKSYIGEVLFRPALVLLTITPVFSIGVFLSTFDRWSTFVLSVTASVIVTVPLVLIIGMNKSERNIVYSGSLNVTRKLGLFQAVKVIPGETYER